MIAAMWGYAFPFILVAALFILWAWSGYKLRFKYPRYYEWCLKIYDSLPKILTAIVIAILIILFFTTESYYNQTP